MAAVICSSISGLCSGLGNVICLPCKACGMGCEAIGDTLKSPFFPYLALTFFLNIPPFYYGIKSTLVDCPELSNWLIGNAFFCLAHMVASIYVVGKIRESRTPDTNASPDSKLEEGQHYNNFSFPKSNEMGAENSCARIKYVLCYDKKMALYIVVAILWIVWLAMGLNKRLIEADGGGCDELYNYVGIAIGAGYMYMCMVGLAFACSLCCLR